MDIPEIIRKKRNGEKLSEAEIQFFVTATVKGEIQDSQLGAMLMAMCIRDLDDEEATCLTKEMTYSGEVLKWPEGWKGSMLDKHSTGGVGDKVSLVLVPMLAACGFKVPMVSGRGLEHTGGTLDKLESIPGFNVNFTKEQIVEVLDKVGCCIVGQTSNLVPADKRMYAIRDVTATIDNNGLITASIISKKLAESLDALVLDVKFGSGAFLKTEQQARELATQMVKAANDSGVKTVALLTDMSSPIGNMVGNALEVVEVLHCLQGNGPADLMDLVIRLGGRLLLRIGDVTALKDGYSKLSATIKDGSALAKFNIMMKAQGVEEDQADQLCKKDAELFNCLRKAKIMTEVKAKNAGFIHELNAKTCGEVSSKLGAGRKKAGEPINHAVGLELRVKVGDRIEEGETWVIVHHDYEFGDDLLTLLESAIDVRAEEYKLLYIDTRVIDVIDISSTSNEVAQLYSRT